MLNRKRMNKNSLKSDGLVVETLTDLYDLIKKHSDLGFYELDVFVNKKISTKAYVTLYKKGYYCRVYDFQCLPNEGRLYIAWG